MLNNIQKIHIEHFQLKSSCMIARILAMIFENEDGHDRVLGKFPYMYIHVYMYGNFPTYGNLYAYMRIHVLLRTCTIHICVYAIYTL